MFVVVAALARQALAFQVCGQSVVFLEIAERRLGPTERVRRNGRALATRVDADLRPRLSHR
jgi:intracellular sulfur oxidation DsrE/DsrF family protein